MTTELKLDYWQLSRVLNTIVRSTQPDGEAWSMYGFFSISNSSDVSIPDEFMDKVGEMAVKLESIDNQHVDNQFDASEMLLNTISDINSVYFGEDETDIVELILEDKTETETPFSDMYFITWSLTTDTDNNRYISVSRISDVVVDLLTQGESFRIHARNVDDKGNLHLIKA